MLSLASILNPSPPRAPPSPQSYSSPGSSSPESRFVGYPSVSTRKPMAEKQRTPKDNPGFSKSKVKGSVKFCPFEDLDEKSLREVRRFRVTPFGSIRNNCRHIPYNSGKKDFFEKTGRESFEVFQYTFKLPHDETEYTVMWDYNVGLVRMTPFFKCCNYPKTTPAKMLNMNPGLRDITHSITGGSIMAQGYWMPFSCAKAVCATFCHHISGALIPIFGTQFPSECIHPDAPDHGRMCIDPALVADAALEAEHFRNLYAEQASAGTTATISPLRRNINDYNDRPRRHPYNNSGSPYQSRHQHYMAGHLPDSPYGTDTEEYYPQTPSSAPAYRTVQHTAPAPTSTSWTTVNDQHWHAHAASRYQPSDRHMFHHALQPQPRADDRDKQPAYNHANPFLTALPRLPDHTPQSSPSRAKHYLSALPPTHHNCHIPASHPLLAGPPTPVMSPKRPRDSTDHDDYHHDSTSPTTTPRAFRDGEYKFHHHHRHGAHQHSRSDLHLPPITQSLPSTSTSSQAERNAALLLLNLSMTEGPNHHGGCQPVDSEGTQTENKKPTASSRAWTSFPSKMATGHGKGLDLCHDDGDGPAPKKRRTISI